MFIWRTDTEESVQGQCDAVNEMFGLRAAIKDSESLKAAHCLPVQTHEVTYNVYYVKSRIWISPYFASFRGAL